MDSLDSTSVTPHRIRIGPAGWSYKDWEGIVYPAAPGRRFDPLAFLADSFDTIEVNSSFYRIPPPGHAASWVRRTAANPEFRFAAKLWRGFTHQTDAAAGDADAFRRFLAPLAESGRLGALLIQFPWSFKDSPESRLRLERLFEAFRDYPAVVEFRHGSFQQEEIFELLAAHRVGFANIDQPLFGDSVRPAAVATAPLAYIRLHGRNYAKWFEHEESWERYDYLYTKEELAPWVERARALAAEHEVYVITNNHFRGQAIVNALDLQRELGQPAEAWQTLQAAWPDRFREKE
ncbi:MAG TPA: DUF72 domain-containing protein [Thermoanaerobaculia bacterium]|nr:DUF72 domain-containing protein [Thermoanaerobaculia bacterium]